MFCNNCGNELPENAKFCNKCGTAVKIAENKTCLNCGNELPKGAAFCNICGAKCGVSPFDKLMPTEEMEFCCKRGLECLGAEAYSAAKSHFQKAAEAGHAESQYQLACMFHGGIGISKNETAATKWYFKAAMQGHANAQYCLSRQYITGDGIERNFTAAARWLRLSEKQNCANALLLLGFLYDPIELNTIERKTGEENIAISSNVNKAREYYIKAMENGSKNAFICLSRLDLCTRLIELFRTNDRVGIENAVTNFIKSIEPLFYNSGDEFKSVSMPVISPNFHKKLNGALSYANLVPNELPIMILDSTITRNGKTGILLTTQALYFKDTLEKTIKFSLDDLPSLTSGLDTKFNFGTSTVYYKLLLNDIEINELFHKRQSVDLLISVIKFIANGFKYINGVQNYAY